jgi:ribosomal protein S27AE
VRFEPPTIKQRGQVANAMAAVHAHKPEVGERTGRITCTRCGSSLRFTIMANGISRGQCAAAGCIRWSQ